MTREARTKEAWEITAHHADIISELRSSQVLEAAVQTLDPTLSMDKCGSSADGKRRQTEKCRQKGHIGHG